MAASKQQPNAKKRKGDDLQGFNKKQRQPDRSGQADKRHPAKDKHKFLKGSKQQASTSHVRPTVTKQSSAKDLKRQRPGHAEQ